MDPRMADVTFATATVNSFWEFAALSQIMQVCNFSSERFLLYKRETIAKNNQRNNPATLRATHINKPTLHRSVVPTQYSSFTRVKTTYKNRSLIS